MPRRVPRFSGLKSPLEEIRESGGTPVAVNLNSRYKTVPVTFKTSPGTLFKLEQIAELRGLTRSTLLDLMAEAVVDGKLPLEVPAHFAGYSTRKNAPSVARDERIEARLLDMNAQDVARVKAIVAESKARLKDKGVFKMVDLKEVGRIV